MTSKSDLKRNLLLNEPGIVLDEYDDLGNREDNQLTRDLSEIKHEIWWMRILYFLSGLTSSTWGRFGSIYYMTKGLNAEEIGVIEGCMPIVKAVFGFFWGYISDVTNKKAVYFVTRVCGTSVLCLLGWHALVKYDFKTIMAISLGAQAFNSGGVLDAWTFDLLGDHAQREYGKIRLFMALSWGIGCFGMSWITDNWGFNYNFILYASLAGVSVLVMTCLPKMTPIEKQIKAVGPDRRIAIQALCRIPVMMFFLEMFIMGMGVGVVERLLFVYMKMYLRASTVLCGTAALMTVLLELPIFYAMDWLNRKLGYNLLMMIAQFCYSSRVYLYTRLNIDTKNYIILIEVLHGFTFGFLWIGAKEYQRKITPVGWQGTFSSILAVIYGALGNGMGAIAGGYCFKKYGARKTYRGSAAIVGGLLVIRLTITICKKICKCCGSRANSK